MIPRQLMVVAKPGTEGWKPAPGMLLRLLKETGTARARALVVGDYVSDRQAAERACMAFAWAWAFFDWPNGAADRTIDWTAWGEDIWRSRRPSGG
jgi:phosphoglycolate phosphatase-like HAD superfamily hydrolase